MAATASASREDIKVVLIDTRYVETDLDSFKSVVQRLTGKDCCVSWIDDGSVSCRKTEENNVVGKVAAHEGTAAAGCGYSTTGGGSGFDIIGDLDTLILEAPPLDELSWLWAE
ncbi:hypothetical protein V6N13_132570 [Hibiscus sabdariffa]|uniref:VQ domain-containing protein n=1 Tax=Hibiscus sabdariffa TaxID=183260 RepID=A0ABR2PVQ2_9ROSI